MGSSPGFSAFLDIAEAMDYIRATRGAYSLQQQLELALRWEREGGRTPAEGLELRNAIIDMQKDLFHHGDGGPSFGRPQGVSLGGGASPDSSGVDWASLGGDFELGDDAQRGIDNPRIDFGDPGLPGNDGGES